MKGLCRLNQGSQSAGSEPIRREAILGESLKEDLEETVPCGQEEASHYEVCSCQEMNSGPWAGNRTPRLR